MTEEPEINSLEGIHVRKLHEIGVKVAIWKKNRGSRLRMEKDIKDKEEINGVREGLLRV